MYPVLRLQPGEAHTVAFRLAVDRSMDLPFTNEEGLYEFYAEYRPTPVDLAGPPPPPEPLMKSPVLRIQVREVPPQQEEALSAYRQGLARFADFRPSDWATREEIKALARFLERFPDSLYSRDPRDGLYSALGIRLGAQAADLWEAELLQRLKKDPRTLGAVPRQESL